MTRRKFNLYDRVIIQDLYSPELNGCIGEIFAFAYIDNQYHYNIKLENGGAVSTPEQFISTVAKHLK